MANPNKKYLRKIFGANMKNEYLYKRARFSEFSIYAFFEYTLKSQNQYGFWITLKLLKTVDFREQELMIQNIIFHLFLNWVHG